MALLGKKYITKSAIFKSVEGYSGTPDAMERMFERDKTDLRDLGITIEVGGFDPLFDDEPGYRILNSNYTFNLGDLSSEEIGLLALAADIWSQNLQSESARSGLRKIKSLAPIDEDEFTNQPHYSLAEQPTAFHDLWQAVTNRQEVLFDYSSAKSGTQSRRTVHPYGIGSWYGSWYLVGNELESGSIKAYRLSRIIGEVKRSSRSDTFTIPDGFNVSDHLIMTKTTGDEPCVIQVKKGSCLNLRALSRTITENDGFDLLEIYQVQRAELIRAILWSGPDAEVISPHDMRDEIRSSLERLLAR